MHKLSGDLLRMLKAAGQATQESRPTLELNLTHPLVQCLKFDDAKFADWANLLFDQTTLADPSGFAKRLNAMLLGMASK
ncbi:MAG: hypothetical protein HHJ09_06925 [Glaciimonas sp.]|nr:hypothetical protein [Glaciimonas sp.]